MCALNTKKTFKYWTSVAKDKTVFQQTTNPKYRNKYRNNLTEFRTKLDYYYFFAFQKSVVSANQRIRLC